MKKIAVLMTCYNRVQTTLSCLESLFACPVPDGYSFDVWLVDDVSPDGTGSKVQRAYPRVHVLKSSGDLFWCKGMRMAWDAAAAASDYDAYLWLNDDVRVCRNSMTVLIEDSEALGWNENSSFVIVGACCDDKLPEKLVYGCYDEHVKILRPNGEPQLAANHSMTGNFVMVPRAVYRVIGPICGLYSHAYGDGDYLWMMRRNDIKLYCMSEVAGVCPRQPSRYLHFKDRSLFQRSKLLFEPKGIPLHDIFIYKWRNYGALNAFGSVVFAILRVLLGREYVRKDD